MYLQLKHNAATAITAAKNERTKEVDKVLDEIRSAVGKMFTNIGCDPDSLELLGENEVTNSNINTYLKVMEMRTIQLINVMHYIYNKVGYREESYVCGIHG